MKTISLRKYYYPVCQKEVLVELPDEVAEAIAEAARAENASDAKQHYHCYSLDASPGIENHSTKQASSPEDILVEEENEQEREAARALMLKRLTEAMETLTPPQTWCLNARFMEEKMFKEIAAAEDISVSLATAHVRAYVKDNFVDKGMCADFAIHDKGIGNPHVHIMLTIRPLKEDGSWGAKCRKAYDLDEHGQRIPDGNGGWKNHREDTTDWNDKGNVEIWRAAWAAYTNRALEAAGRPERIDHRSYKRQGIDKIPSVHFGPAASQMEKRGIRTDKGEVNRQIAADNKLLKEIKARVTRLYNWSKAEAEKPAGAVPSILQLWEAQQQLKQPATRNGKIQNLQENAALFSFLQANQITTVAQLHEKIAEMNTRYYDLRGEIVKAERRIAVLQEHLNMVKQYEKHRPVRRQLDWFQPGKRELFEERHTAELILFDAADRYLNGLKGEETAITPKAWRAEIAALTVQMKAMREELKAVERLKKAAQQLEKQEMDRHK